MTSYCIVESTFLTFAVHPLSVTHNTYDQPPHMAVLKRKSTWTVSLWDTGIVFSCPQGTNQRYSLYLYENTLICMKQRWQDCDITKYSKILLIQHPRDQEIPDYQMAPILTKVLIHNFLLLLLYVGLHN